jgi:alkylation response protein AidB-like acyl-CoA dehydrogenase
MSRTRGSSATGANPVDLDAFRAEAQSWLRANAPPRPADELVFGQGSDSVALFRNLNQDDEQKLIDERRRWIQRKATAGFANLHWAVEWGGRGLPRVYERAFAAEEAAFVTPPSHEAIEITTQLIGPTLLAEGTDVQKQRFLRPLLRTEEMWCQLFSEPGAGSDLAGVATRAVRDGDEWVLNGQKVWTSGAQFADWGYALCRTNHDAPKHRGITAFIVPMSAIGVEVRPLRQMTGGSSFNEVFLNEVRVSDGMRIGPIDGGWRVAVTTLGFERTVATGGGGLGTAKRLISLAQHVGRGSDATTRQVLTDVYGRQALGRLSNERMAATVKAGQRPGPEGSIGKLWWTEGLRATSQAASDILGVRIVADTGEWGTYAWSEHVLGTAGYRIAGGSDEVQRNIIGERVLGLPAEPGSGRDLPFRELPR